MHRFFPHPATLQLLRYQATARVSRTLRSFRGRRRLLLSILSVLLAVLWLGQVVAGILFREPADPQKLAVWIPLGLLAYSLWHLLKAACRTPIEPFEWTPAERELLGAAPLRRRELVMYRLIAIAVAAVAKAACFSLVMLPDLHVWLAGFAGMLMALLFVDLIRMAIEILAYGMSRKAFIRFRIVVLAAAGMCLGIALLNSLPFPDGETRGGEPTALFIGLRILNSLMDLRTTWLGSIAETPFHVFASVILTPRISMTLVTHLLLAAALVMILAESVVRLDSLIQQWRIAAERSAFQRLFAGVSVTAGQQESPLEDALQLEGALQQPGSHRPAVVARGCHDNGLPAGRITETRRRLSPAVRVPVRVWGAGSLAWRQALGAFHYRTSVGVALIVPGFLSCLTLLTPQYGPTMLIQLVGGLVFYSFLLLPTALKFDFRRDIDRLAVIKALPASPTAVTLGQLVVPVVFCTLFQMVVLLIAIVVRPYHPALYIAAVVVLVPMNVLIFALENLIFLLYPYRLNQEGFGVFLRSILAFTAKSILFVIALLIALVWALLSKQLATRLIPSSELVGVSVVFVTGMWALVTAAAMGTIALLTSVYRRFDPSQDTPAAS